MLKKFLGVGSLFSGIFCFNLVSAYYFPSMRDVSQGVIDAWINFLAPILQALFGGFGGDSLYLFEKLLLFILMICIVFLALGKIPIFSDKKGIKWIIAVVVPLIGIRFINYEWLSTVILQYVALTIALTSLLPFVIYFIFLYETGDDYPFIRKIGWALFIIIYLGLWSSTEIEANSTVYFWTFIAGFVMLIFDTKIKKIYDYRQAMKKDSSFKWREVGRINTEIHEIHRQISIGALDRKKGDKLIQDLEKHKKEILKHL